MATRTQRRCQRIPYTCLLVRQSCKGTYNPSVFALMQSLAGINSLTFQTLLTMRSKPVLMYKLSWKRLTALVHPKPVFMNQLCRGEDCVGGLPRLLPGDTKLRSRSCRSDSPCESIQRPFVVDQTAHEFGLGQYAVLPGDPILLLATIMAEAYDRLDFPFLVAVDLSFVPDIDAELAKHVA